MKVANAGQGTLWNAVLGGQLGGVSLWGIPEPISGQTPEKTRPGLSEPPLAMGTPKAP